MKVSLAIHVVVFISSVSARLFEVNSRLGEDVDSDGSAFLVHQPKSNTEVYQYDRKLLALNNVTNVALGKPTSQSSTRWGGFSSRAVDGNPNGKWRTTTHTVKQMNASWEVDLLDDFSVSSVKVYNRADNRACVKINNRGCYSGRLSGSKITLYDETKTNSLTLAGPPNTFGLDSFTLDFATENLLFPTRFVVVSLPGQYEILSLAEVEVNGVPSSPAALCQVKECNDNNACTTDRCNTTTGECEFSPIAGCKKEVQPDVLEFYLVKEDMTVTYGELVEMLSANGFSTKGNKNTTRRHVRGLQTTFDFLPDCQFLLPEGSLEERELSFSYLVCDAQVADGVSVVSTALAASCKNNEALTECSGDVFTIGTDIQIHSDGSELSLELSLPATDTCSGFSKEEAKACFRASVDIISAGVAIGDTNGNEVSFGASIGFGGGASGGFDDGVLCVNISAKLGIGFDLGFCARLGKPCSEFDSVALCCRDRTLEGVNPDSFRQCLIDRDVDPTIDDVHLNGAIVDWCRGAVIEGGDPNAFRKCLTDRGLPATFDDTHLNGEILNHCRANVNEGGDPDAYRKCFTDRGLPETFDDTRLNQEILNHCRAWVVEGADPNAFRKCLTDRGLLATFDDTHLNQEIRNHCRASVIEGVDPNAFRKCFTDRGLPATFDDAHLNLEIVNHCRANVVEGGDPNAYRKCLTDRGLPATFDDAHLKQQIVNHCRAWVVEGADPNAFRKCLTDRGIPATADDENLKQQIINHCRAYVVEGRDPNAFRKCFSDRGLPQNTDDVRLKKEIINHCRASVLEGANPNAFRKCLTDRGLPASADNASLRRQIIAYCNGACVFGGCNSQCRKDRGI